MAEGANDAPPEGIPDRFTIRPDDWYIPYAGTSDDGRKFFLSSGLRNPSDSYVGLFLWKADGSFDSIKVERVDARDSSGDVDTDHAEELVAARLEELGEFTLEPITVAHFIKKVDGVEFGWKVGRYDNGTVYINIEPGNFICYYAPWDGYDYDT